MWFGELGVWEVDGGGFIEGGLGWGENKSFAWREDKGFVWGDDNGDRDGVGVDDGEIKGFDGSVCTFGFFVGALVDWMSG